MGGFIEKIIPIFKEVKQRELDPVQRAILDEIRRRNKKPKAKILQDPNNPGSFFIPEIGMLITPKRGE